LKCGVSLRLLVGVETELGELCEEDEEDELEGLLFL
jgi:hypothetical protein